MSNYLFDLITKSGDNIDAAGNLISIGNTPSINNLGSVAFIGKFGTGFQPPRDLLVADSLGNLSNLSSSYTWRFSDQVQINDNNKIVTRDTVSSLQALRVWDAALANSYYVETTGGYPAGGLDFEWLYLFQRLNNNDDAVFIADPKDGGKFNTVVATHKEFSSSGFREYNQASVPSSFIKPDIADNGTVVFRDPISTITLNDYQLNPIAVIASNSLGFSSVGLATNISDDGKAVAFYGDLDNPGATSATQDLEAGKGIFISVETDSGRKIHRIAGIAGNGILDPGETHNDINENGEVDSGEDKGLIGGFNFDEPIGISSSEANSGEYGTVAFLASDENGVESLISSKYNISDSAETLQTNVSTDLVAKVGEAANKVNSDLTGDIQDLNIYDPINDLGQIAFWTKTTNGEEAIVRANPIKNPILILPGIGGSLPIDSVPAFPGQVSNYSEWVRNRGVDPSQLQIENVRKTYDDLIETFKRAGYQEGVDLFVAPYDWRLNLAPIDGTIDGRIEYSAAQLMDDTHEYAVDQLGYWLEQAEIGWKSQFTDEENIPELEAVDLIAHSTGGLVGKSYIQSDAYGADYTDPNNNPASLPKIDNFFVLAVPNRGSSLTWNPLNNNFIGGPGIRTARAMIRSAYQKVKNGETITVDGSNTANGAIEPPTDGSEPDVEAFIEQYIPTYRSLISNISFYCYQ